jgi:hypothetical protein
MTDEEYYASLAPDEQIALNRYKDNPFKLNEKIRKKAHLKSDEHDQVEQLDSAISKYTSQVEITVFRGFSDADLFDIPVNSEVIFPAFSSTTFSRIKGCEFTGKANEYGKPILLKLKIPKGCSMALMEGNTDFNPDEREILLPRNIIVRITDRELINDKECILSLDGNVDWREKKKRTGIWNLYGSQLQEVLYLTGEVVVNNK